MKVVIRGVRYDTDKAEVIAEQNGGQWPHNWREALCRLPRGRLFLSGEGGPFSRWGRRVDGHLMNGFGIMPLSEEEAAIWLRAKED